MPQEDCIQQDAAGNTNSHFLPGKLVEEDAAMQSWGWAPASPKKQRCQMMLIRYSALIAGTSHTVGPFCAGG